MNKANMHQYYGMVFGKSPQPATRLGTKSSGLITRARTRDGEIHTRLYYDEQISRDMYEVTLEYYHHKTMHKIILARGAF